MIIGVPLFVADGKPCANPTEFCWFGVGTRGRRARPQKIISDLPVIGNITSDRERLHFGVAQHHVHSLWYDTLSFGQNLGIEAELEYSVGSKLWYDTLSFGQNLGIEAELEYSVGSSGPREFRFCHFVGPGTQRARFLDLDQEIRPPSPSPVFQRPLIDHIRPRTEGFCCLRHGVLPGKRRWDLHHIQTFASV